MGAKLPAGSGRKRQVRFGEEQPEERTGFFGLNFVLKSSLSGAWKQPFDTRGCTAHSAHGSRMCIGVRAWSSIANGNSD